MMLKNITTLKYPFSFKHLRKNGMHGLCGILKPHLNDFHPEHHFVGTINSRFGRLYQQLHPQNKTML